MGRASLIVAAALLAAALGPLGRAWAATAVEFRPALLPASPGSATEVVFEARFQNSAGALPAPLTGVDFFLPEGLVNSRLEWPTTLGCSRATLLRQGPAGCPPRSQIGFGSALLALAQNGVVHTLRVPLALFVGPTNGPYVLELYGEAPPPLRRRQVLTEELAAVSAPFSAAVSTKVPPLVGEAGTAAASVLEVRVVAGAREGGSSSRLRPSGPRRRKRGRPRRGRHGPLWGGLHLFTPKRCPRGGYRWEATFTFADGTSETLRQSTPCP